MWGHCPIPIIDLQTRKISRKNCPPACGDLRALRLLVWRGTFTHYIVSWIHQTSYTPHVITCMHVTTLYSLSSVLQNDPKHLVLVQIHNSQWKVPSVRTLEGGICLFSRLPKGVTSVGKKEHVWQFFGFCTADSQTDTGRHQLYNDGSLVIFSTAWT